MKTPFPTRRSTKHDTYIGVKAKICLVGEHRVGKSALVHRYVLDQFSDKYLATLGMKVYKKLVFVEQPGSNEAIPVTMSIWDIMGDGQYGESIREIYMHGASGIIAVADVTNPGTVKPLQNWVNPALELLGDIPVQIVLNKRDLGEEEEARSNGIDIAKTYVAPCYLTSANRGDNVERAFEELAHRILVQITSKSKPVTDNRLLEVLVDSLGQSRTLEELSAELGVPPPQAEPQIRSLVRTGHLVLEKLEIAPDGSPVMRYAATGKLL